MGQDLNRMVSVFVDGKEEVRKIVGFMFHTGLNCMVPIPILSDDEVVLISVFGELVIMDIDSINAGGNC